MEINKILEIVKKTNPTITIEKLVEELLCSSPATINIMSNISKEG